MNYLEVLELVAAVIIKMGLQALYCSICVILLGLSLFLVAKLGILFLRVIGVRKFLGFRLKPL